MARSKQELIERLAKAMYSINRVADSLTIGQFTLVKENLRKPDLEYLLSKTLEAESLLLTLQKKIKGWNEVNPQWRESKFYALANQGHNCHWCGKHRDEHKGKAKDKTDSYCPI